MRGLLEGCNDLVEWDPARRGQELAEANSLEKTHYVLYMTVKRLETGIRLNRVSTTVHPIPYQMGSHLGSILYIYGSCLSKPQVGQGGSLESRNSGKCLGL